MASHVSPPHVGDFPFRSLPLSQPQDFTDYYITHPFILFHPHQLLQFMHQEATRHPNGDGGTGYDYEYWTSVEDDSVSAAEDDYEDTVSEAEAGIEDWMSVAEVGEEDLMIDYDADEEGSMATPQRDEGLPEEVVAGFLNTAAFKKKAAAAGEVCAVCLDDLYEEDRTVGVLGCGHGFHGGCIGEWLRRKNACPLCRAIAL